MFVSRDREKLVNAIIFFLRKTKRCQTTKLFKLLNFLDFEHFRVTGRGVTGLAYKAWQFGPAPPDLWHEFEEVPTDLSSSISIIQNKDEITGELKGRSFVPKKQFDDSHFSPRELEIMELLAEIFRDTSADQMTGVSHSRNLPWERVYQGGKGRGLNVPYELSLDSDVVIGSLKSLPKEEVAFRRNLHKEIEAEAS